MHKNREQGFVGIILLVIIALALLKYLINFDIFQAAGSKHGQETISYTAAIVRTIWSYISTPVMFVWDNILLPVLKLVWQAFEQLLATSKSNLNGTSTDIFH